MAMSRIQTHKYKVDLLLLKVIVLKTHTLKPNPDKNYPETYQHSWNKLRVFEANGKEFDSIKEK